MRPFAYASGCVLVAAALCAACKDDSGATIKQQPPPTAQDGGTDGSVTPAGLAPCLDKPNELARPPSGELPCDLLPPGFTR